MNVEYRVTECPHCYREIMAGQHRFGPAKVVCYGCKQVIETGLTPWAELSTGRKLLLALSELIVPSWNRPVWAFLGNLFAWWFVSGAIALLGHFTLSSVLSSGSTNTSIDSKVLIFAAFSGFILVPGLRLIRMIVESNRHSKSRIPPVWRVSPLLRRGGK